MNIVNIFLGILLLILGRKLFWLFVGIVGFIVGFNLTTNYLSAQSEWVILIVALVVGVLGAIFAGIAQRFAVAVAGFLAGGYLANNLLDLIGWEAGNLSIVFYILGGIIGALLVFLLFDWALIVLSSLVGANLIVQSLPALQTNQPGTTILLLILFVVGIVVQAGIQSREADVPIA